MGDCDDFSMLLASMLVGSGLPVDVYFTTVAVDDAEPNRWSHVFVKTVFEDDQGNHRTDNQKNKRQEKVYCLDGSHGAYPGWTTEGIHRLKDWPVSEGKSMRAYTRDELTVLGHERLGYSGLGDEGDGLGIPWGDFIGRGIDTGLNIATNLTDPRFREGTFSTIRNLDGSTEVIQRAASGPSFGVNTFPGGGAGFSDDMIKYGLIALTVGGFIMMLKK